MPLHTDSVRIAICDDHDIFLASLCQFVPVLGNFIVECCANNCEEFIEKLSSLETPPHICIVDINMKPLNGWETMCKIRALWPSVKFLALTLLTPEGIVDKLIKYEVNGYLPKNCKSQELKTALEQIHVNDLYFSENTLKLIYKYSRQDSKGQLSNMELTYLKYCGSDLTCKEIATEMSVSPRTVDGYRDSIYKKLNLKTRQGLLMYAIKNGIIYPF